eukprot:4557733-Prorocentrum_lima.AAC.1
MTSSLVGSEMCIRDRSKPFDVVANLQAEEKLQEATQLLQDTREEEFHPVSYTHLTLPTICSV